MTGPIGWSPGSSGKGSFSGDTAAATSCWATGVTPCQPATVQKQGPSHESHKCVTSMYRELCQMRTMYDGIWKDERLALDLKGEILYPKFYVPTESQTTCSHTLVRELDYLLSLPSWPQDLAEGHLVSPFLLEKTQGLYASPLLPGRSSSYGVCGCGCGGLADEALAQCSTGP